MRHKNRLILSKVLITTMMIALAFTSAHAAIINGMLVDATDSTELMQATVALLKTDRDSTYPSPSPTSTESLTLRTCRQDTTT